ncbi:MAG: hypothetical protein JWP35_2443 [Caulobacter sp.]|nr:hypothetical protein [Caulobacter sp.]
MSGGPLRLLAQDAADLDVISAALQDAVAKIGDIAFEPGPRRLTIAFNRFRWESEGRAGAKAGERIRTGLQLGGVMSVQARKLRREAKDAVVSLMSVSFEPGEAPGGAIVFTFAGGGDLRAEVECIDAALADVSEAWPTPRKPGHD